MRANGEYYIEGKGITFEITVRNDANTVLYGIQVYDALLMGSNVMRMCVANTALAEYKLSCVVASEGISGIDFVVSNGIAGNPCVLTAKAYDSI